MIGDDEDVKLDQAGQVRCVWAPRSMSPTLLLDIQPNGDAPLDHPVFPQEYEPLTRAS